MSLRIVSPCVPTRPRVARTLITRAASVAVFVTLAAVLFAGPAGALVAAPTLPVPPPVPPPVLGVPNNVPRNLGIMGPEKVTPAELVAWYEARHTSTWRASVPVLDMATYYLEEGAAEGVRGDVAFMQAVHETGWFSGIPEGDSNNFAGIGVCNSCGGHGLRFATAQLGVRAQIQLLRSWADRTATTTTLASPAFDGNAYNSQYNRGKISTWVGLDGHWAVPGYNYGERLLNMYADLLTFAHADSCPDLVTLPRAGAGALIETFGKIGAYWNPHTGHGHYVALGRVNALGHDGSVGSIDAHGQITITPPPAPKGTPAKMPVAPPTWKLPAGATATAAVLSSDSKGIWVTTTNGNVAAFGTALQLGPPIVDSAQIAADNNTPSTSLPTAAPRDPTADAPASTNPTSTNPTSTNPTANGATSSGALPGGPTPTDPVAGAPVVNTFVASDPVIQAPKVPATVGVAATASDDGLWLVDATGQVTAYGSANTWPLAAGSTTSSAAAVGIVVIENGKGYWVAYADGHVATYGEAPAIGGLDGCGLGRTVTGIARDPIDGGILLATNSAIYRLGFARAGWLAASAGLVTSGLTPIPATHALHPEASRAF